MATFQEMKDADVQHVDVRGSRLGGGGTGGERTLSFSFFRRYNIATQNWALQFVRGGPQKLGGEWVFAPGDTGGDIGKRMAAWNQIEAARMPGRPKAMWWGEPNDNVIDSKWHKNLGTPLKLATRKAGFELAEDVIGTPDTVSAELQTTRPNSVWEEIKTEFFMEAALEELGGRDLTQLSKERTGDFENFVAMMNNKGLDFARYSEYETAEMEEFLDLMEAAWDHAGGKDMGDWSGVAGREQTSDATGKFFLHGLDGRISELQAETGADPGSAEAGDIIRQAFAEEAIRNLDDVNAYIQSKYQGDLVQAIYSERPEKKSKEQPLESLSYYAKQLADRALVMSIWETFSELGNGTYDYYMPLPSKSTLGFQESSWMGLVRITPDVIMETQYDQHGNADQQYPVLTRIDAQADAIYVGRSGVGKTGGMPINAILNYLQMSGKLDAEQVTRICARVSSRTAEHIMAQESSALVGGMMTAQLSDTTALEYLDSMVNIKHMVELSSTQEMADNIRDQFEQFGQGLQGKLGEWYETQIDRSNRLARDWRTLGRLWWGARQNFRAAAKKSGVNVPSSKESSMFRDDTGGGGGTIGNVMNRSGQGRLIGTPFFLSTGPFNPKQWDAKRGTSAELISPQTIAGGGTAVQRASDPAWKTSVGQGAMGWSGVEDAPIRFGAQSWEQYEGGSDAAADARLSARQARLGVGPGY